MARWADWIGLGGDRLKRVDRKMDCDGKNRAGGRASEQRVCMCVPVRV